MHMAVVVSALLLAVQPQCEAASVQATLGGAAVHLAAVAYNEAGSLGRQALTRWLPSACLDSTSSRRYNTDSQVVLRAWGAPMATNL